MLLEITQSIQQKIKNNWPEKIKMLSNQEKEHYKTKIKMLLKKKNACLVSHYYVDSSIQELTEETNGILGDSLSMASFGQKNNSKILVVCGVRFMGETAKILSPNKKIIMPNIKAECSLDLSCNPSEFKNFIQQNQDRTVVVYVNTSAEIKSMADWTVTSSNALEICTYLKKQNKKILWAPDKYLGKWIEKKTQANMIHYHGFCIVHEEFKHKALLNLKKRYKDAAILVHPESPQEIIQLADIVGSTSVLLKASKELKNKIFIVATDRGIFYKMKKHSPNKIFIEAPTTEEQISCQSCAHCPWMATNNLKNLSETLEHENNEIILDNDTLFKALKPLTRMLNFQKHNSIIF